MPDLFGKNHKKYVRVISIIFSIVLIVGMVLSYFAIAGF